MSLSYKNFVRMEEYIESFQDKRSSLIIILHKAQEIFGYIPEDVQKFIAESVGVPVEKVSEIVNFYSFFATEPKAKYEILVCLGVKCKRKGAKEIVEHLKEKLHIDLGGVTPDGLFTLKSVNCLGACGSAPVVVVGQRMIAEANIDKIMGVISEITGHENQA